MGRLEVLARARARANEGMTEAIRGGEWTDGVDANLNATRVLTITRYTGPAQIKYVSDTVSDQDTAGQVTAEQKPIVKIPIDGALLYEGDEIIVDSSSADATLQGRRYRIAGSPEAGQTSSHRYPLVELS